MPDREKVIKEFELFIKEFHPACTSECVELDMFREVLALLKEQEPKTVLGIADPFEGIEVGKCPRCEKTILNKQSDPTWFCKYCGQAVKWND